MVANPFEVYLVSLNPTIGSEMKKTRPCVVLSPTEMNLTLKTLIVAPLTTKLKPFPFRVDVVHNGVEGMIALDQIRTVDKSRIIKKLGHLHPQEIINCKQTIKQMFVD